MASLPDRPKGITPEMQRQILEAVACGNYFSVACRAAGTTPQAIDWWRKLVAQGAEHASVYADFFVALARVQAIAEVNAVGHISRGSNGWQGPAWMIERRYRQRWGRVEKESEPTVKPGVIGEAQEKANARKRTRKPDGPPG